ncbi:chloride channel [Rhodotorula sphaerocarpa]
MPLAHEASTSRNTLDVEPDRAYMNGDAEPLNGTGDSAMSSGRRPRSRRSGETTDRRSAAPSTSTGATRAALASLPPSGHSIDWTLEFARARTRAAQVGSEPGLRGVSARLWLASEPWVVVVVTGLATGTIASCLDILSAWLSDLRLGMCRDMWWMSRGLCCAGLDPDETCRAWQSWGELVASEKHIVTRTLAQYGVLLAVTSSAFVNVFAPHASHTGIPEIKVILGGYNLAGFLSPITLVIKSLGLPLAVASGLSLGKEGPLVHVACCIGDLALRPFKALRGNGARRREILSAAAAAGVSVAFGAPLGGVLFALEEISTFFPGSTLWQSFVCAIVAAVTLQYIDPFNTGKLALYTVTASQVWRGFELVPWFLLGIAGGFWGVWLIRLNGQWERLRRSTGLKEWPVTEVTVLALFTAAVSYLIAFMRIPTTELVVNLFRDCSEPDPYGLCDATNTSSVVVLLLIAAFAKTLLTAVTFGASIPAGIFLPSLAVGACAGRAVGLVMDQMHRANPESWIFSDCPADGGCINPSVYAVIGAAGALGGVTRMTISLVVILFELTGAIDIVLQLMMAVMVAKFTADYISRDGIYETWINLRRYPFLNTKEDYRRDDVLARQIMTGGADLACLSDEGWTVSRIEGLLHQEGYSGFPVVRTLEDRLVLGYIGREELEKALHRARQNPDVSTDTPCYFSAPKRAPAAFSRSAAPDERARGRQIVLPLDPTTAAGTAAMAWDTDLEPADAPPVNHRPRSEKGTEESLSASASPIREERDPQDGRGPAWISLVPWMDEIPVTLSEDTPMEVVVQMFQRLGLRFVLLTRHGVLRGLLTKMDLHEHIDGDADSEVDDR